MQYCAQVQQIDDNRSHPLKPQLDCECAPLLGMHKAQEGLGGGERGANIHSCCCSARVTCSRRYSTSSTGSVTKDSRSHLSGVSSIVGLQVQGCNPADMCSCHRGATHSGNSHVICVGGTGYLNPRSVQTHTLAIIGHVPTSVTAV